MNSPDEVQLERMLDQARSEVFRNDNAAFLASILCSMEFKWWDESEQGYVGTDGKTLFWKKSDFLSCSPDERKWILLHEIWHPARLHFVRGIGKDPKVWNIACDYVINNNMIREGRTIPDNGYWIFDLSIDENGTLSEEEIYNKLMTGQLKMPQCPGDMQAPVLDAQQTQAMATQQVAMVIRAQQAAIAAGKPGVIPGDVTAALIKFLTPVVNWRQALAQWMTALTSEDYSWTQRNRRYPRIYMPGMIDLPEGLEDLWFVIDTSGSITDPAVLRFNSEIKYIWDDMQPEKLTVIQFDTEIHDIRVFNKGDEFEDIKVYGRGGTDLTPVGELIREKRPTAVVIFSDLECAKMVEPGGIPILWARIPGGGHTPDYGTLIEIND